MVDVVEKSNECLFKPGYYLGSLDGRANVTMTMTLQLAYRYRPTLQYSLLRPLRVRQIQITMSSQPPQILSTQDLNTADAKYVT